MASNKTVVGSSMFVGLLMGLCIMYFSTSPHMSYAESMEMLNKHGVVTTVNGELHYQTSNGMTRMQVHALAKMSDIYKIELEVLTFGELDIN
jgi:sensor histidine kinase YesM